MEKFKYNFKSVQQSLSIQCTVCTLVKMLKIMASPWLCVDVVVQNPEVSSVVSWCNWMNVCAWRKLAEVKDELLTLGDVGAVCVVWPWPVLLTLVCLKQQVELIQPHSCPTRRGAQTKPRICLSQKEFQSGKTSSHFRTFVFKYGKIHELKWLNELKVTES